MMQFGKNRKIILMMMVILICIYISIFLDMYTDVYFGNSNTLVLDTSFLPDSGVKSEFQNLSLA